MSIWLPPRVSAQLVDVRRQHQADVLEQAKTDATLDFWTRELRRIDPRLQLIKAHEDAALPGLKPGYYHVLRDNLGAPCSLIPVEGPGGEFREPDSGLFELLRRNDLWNAEAQRDRRRMREQAREAADRRREREREARRQELRERVAALTRTQVSLADVGWSQNMAGRRGRHV